MALGRVKETYTTGARRLASRSIVGLTRTRVTPNALTAAGVSLCVLASILVFFEYRSELLFFWLGARLLRRRVPVRHPRRRPREGGREVDALRRVHGLDDRPGRARRFMLGAIALVLRPRRQRARCRPCRGCDRRLVPRQLHARTRRGLGLRGDVGIGSRAERVVVITAGLVLAPWVPLELALALLAATAWITVLQRVLHVRRQLRARD